MCSFSKDIVKEKSTFSRFSVIGMEIAKYN